MDHAKRKDCSLPEEGAKGGLCLGKGESEYFSHIDITSLFEHVPLSLCLFR